MREDLRNPCSSAERLRGARKLTTSDKDEENDERRDILS